MTKEEAIEFLKKYKDEPDNQVLHIISTAGVWTSLDKIVGEGKPKIESYTFKQLKEIANG